MLLSKEANSKDTQLKSQLLLSFKDDDILKGSENMWQHPGYFGEQRAQLTIQKFSRNHFELCEPGTCVIGKRRGKGNLL